MDYDPLMIYSLEYFRALTLRELQILFEEAKQVSFSIQGTAQIKKVSDDIARMRLLLVGYDSAYNVSNIEVFEE